MNILGLSPELTVASFRPAVPLECAAKVGCRQSPLPIILSVLPLQLSSVDISVQGHRQEANANSYTGALGSVPWSAFLMISVLFKGSIECRQVQDKTEALGLGGTPVW